MKRLFSPLFALMALCAMFVACEDFTSTTTNNSGSNGSSGANGETESTWLVIGVNGRLCRTAMEYNEEGGYYYVELSMGAKEMGGGFRLRNSINPTILIGATEQYDELPLNVDIPVKFGGYAMPLTDDNSLYCIRYKVDTEVIYVEHEQQQPNDDPDNTPEGPEHPSMSAPKVYVDVSATDWTEVYAWAWSLEDPSINYTISDNGYAYWPGVAIYSEVIDGKIYYTWTAPMELDGATIGFIANGGSDSSQTIDLHITLDSSSPVIIVLIEQEYKWGATVNGVLAEEPL